MKTYTIKIELENDAFADGQAGNELRRILDDLATECSFRGEPVARNLRDVNGNTVGRAYVGRSKVTRP